MPFHPRIHRFAGDTVAATGLLGAATAALVWATHPAGAAVLLNAAQTAVTCATTGTTPCLTGKNTDAGPGVFGTSNTGTGVRGSSNSNFGLKATANTRAAIDGESGTGPAGVLGSGNNAGVYGYTNGDGIGVWGSSGGNSGFGVAGIVIKGVAVGAYSNSGIGLQAKTNTGTGIIAASDTSVGLRAVTLASDPSKAAVVAQAAHVALQGTTRSTGMPLLLESGDATVFSVSGTGAVVHAGSLVHVGSTARGADVVAFSPKTTVPAIEDVGTAQLVGGTAAVRLDPTFAATIDAQTGYRVLLTARGDTRGLFVAATTPDGFIVHESQGGRTTVGFDYRIVATPLGGGGQRMATSSAGPQRR